MKLIIASDIHGNVTYTKKLIDLINKINPDNIILLGDLLASYSFDDNFDTYEVATLLNQFTPKIISVRGNCDSYEDNELLCFDNNKNFRTIEVDGITFTLTHGHLFNQYPFLLESEYLLYGHTHYYDLHTNHINPGSVGLPRGGNDHTCVIYENKKIELFSLDSNKIIETKELL